MQNDLRDQFAFFNNKAFKDIERCVEVKCRTYSKHFIDFAKLQSENLTDVFYLN